MAQNNDSVRLWRENIMMLSIQTVKTVKENGAGNYKTYRYACFDTIAEGKSFEEKFNNAMNWLKEEIEQDRNNNDMTKYEPIRIVDVFLS